MCTRYSLHNLEALKRTLEKMGLQVPDKLRAIYNATLSTPMPAVTKSRGVTTLQPLAFGTLLPPKESASKPLLLANARSETLLARGTFKEAARHRRCLVPADGFYEWEKQGQARLPHYFQVRAGEPFFFAGLWRPETPIAPPAFVIVTTTANSLLAPIHDRMPVILADDRAEAWLGDEPLADDRLATLCAPFPAAQMRAHRVSPQMNSARFEGPACIEPFTPPPPEPGLFD